MQFVDHIMLRGDGNETRFARKSGWKHVNASNAEEPLIHQITEIIKLP